MITLTKVLIALGTNQGDFSHNFLLAKESLLQVLDNCSFSDVYITKPWGVENQPDFANAVVAGFTKDAPEILLRNLKQIEQEMGRKENVLNGPRIIDLDLLDYGGLVIDQQKLKTPHPGIPTRDFVLLPLLDVEPNWIHPVSQKNGQTLLQELKEHYFTGLRKDFSSFICQRSCS